MKNGSNFTALAGEAPLRFRLFRLSATETNEQRYHASDDLKTVMLANLEDFYRLRSESR